MIKKIKLRQSGGVLDDREPFLVVDNDSLILEFDTGTNAKEFVIALSNGVQSKLKFKGTSFTVPTEFVKAGILDATIAQIEKGTVVKEWHIEPILIKDVDLGFIGTLVFDDLTNQLAIQADQIKKINKKINGIDVL